MRIEQTAQGMAHVSKSREHLHFDFFPEGDAWFLPFVRKGKKYLINPSDPVDPVQSVVPC
jgi:hypothetical protein